MQSDDLKLTDGAAAGAWIKRRLEGEVGSVTDLVPKGFEAYGRVFHPASDAEGTPTRWAEIARRCGTVPHREMQWHAILGFADADELRGTYSRGNQDGPAWVGSDPPIGTMDIQTLDTLCDILAIHTADPARCFFGLCTIESWENSFSAGELQPLLELPCDRNHIVLTGPLSAVDQLRYDWSGSTQMTFVAEQDTDSPSGPDSSEFVQREAPNLIWPADHSWFVASEVDFDSTLIGGSARLVDAIVGSSRLEAWQVEPTDSLVDDADTVNRTSGD